ncbi:DNA-3-methyladenine glycosylase [Pisciglobus halotolerans]|uniref:Putative 3-methyladenine DNA glycosylase n=1 Tax=Pisciglobus halotolerans TaxID=745365 RepID=A0A1I3BZ80_9LACT|nr:DNA-3-methyladenine glycosylase [Pisciglobus halotolerans]SFH67688.1 DNA-3-methyladenine glycosylase [Pisciglobus halotolerans]
MNFWFDTSLTTQDVAQQLLGCLLIKETEEGLTSGFIVETEAYLGEIDKAAHSYGLRRTPRLVPMYQSAGTIYIYTMHTHHMLNIITKEPDNPQGVLVRAIEPFQGISLMEERRGRFGVELTNGPGKLTKAMNINKEDNGTSIGASPLYLSSKERKMPKKILSTPRIGIPNKGKWTEEPLRYIVEGNPYTTKAKKKAVSNSGWI